MPERIQLKRTKGWRLPANTIIVARPSKWGNPSRAGGIALKNTDHDRMYRADLVENFRNWLNGTGPNDWGQPPSADEIKTALRGKNLACWCRPDYPCHADVLLEIANKQ